MTYYIVERRYVGPNRQQNVDFDHLEIGTEPPRSLWTDEIQEHGRLGCINGVSEYARGAFATLEEAEAAAREDLAELGYRREVPDLGEGPEPLVRYRVGSLKPLNAEETWNVVLDSALLFLTSKTTDAEIESFVEECQDEIAEELEAKVDEETIRETCKCWRDEYAEEESD